MNPELAARDAIKSDALMKRSLALLTDQCLQVENDRDTLAKALSDIQVRVIEVGWMNDPEAACRYAAHVCGLPAVQNAMGA